VKVPSVRELHTAYIASLGFDDLAGDDAYVIDPTPADRLCMATPGAGVDRTVRPTHYES
jgi:hypothetical protein